MQKIGGLLEELMASSTKNIDLKNYILCFDLEYIQDIVLEIKNTPELSEVLLFYY